MGNAMTPLPQWTWEDLEIALDDLGAAGRSHPVREHLVRGLRADATTTPPRELLKTLLCTAVLLSQMGASDTGLRREDRSFG